MEIIVPSVGESVVEALVTKWHRQEGEQVEKDEPICEIETDKITLELNAEADGVLSIRAQAGETVKIGAVIGVIAESEAPAGVSTGKEPTVPELAPTKPELSLSPAVRKLAQEREVDLHAVQGSGRGGRITVDDLLKELGKEGKVEAEAEKSHEIPSAAPIEGAAERQVELPLAVKSEESAPYNANPDPSGKAERTVRKPMSPIRRRIAERLLAARSQTAMLTTFNEVDMGRVTAIRQQHQEQFRKRHGIKLGLMSFFVKACVEALCEFPIVNARIDGDDIVWQNFHDIGIAIGGEKGLVVPVIRDADRLHFAEIEQAIAGFVEKLKTNRLAISDLEGGTFTISNGGVYGSLLSTPIINPPQCGVLGMHAIQERPVALLGKVVVRPMMYLALSYDHRLVDGRDAVGFLKKVKEYIEDPEEMLLEG
jgi:2-oxoglutarate dehydrogenase E2 component (dihydrolipoamide succinyltransferase)